jgi:hypothetical protein
VQRAQTQGRVLELVSVTVLLRSRRLAQRQSLPRLLPSHDSPIVV